MSFRKALILILLAELFVGLLGVYTYGFTIEGLQATTRFSGRLSLVIFSLIFVYLTFNREKLSSLLSEKPFHIFAIAHGIHLIELLSFVYLSGAVLKPVRVAGGFLAYAFIFIMPMIQARFENGKLPGKKYTLLENIYVYYVWFIFFMTYLPRVQGKLPQVGGSYWEFVALLCWVCLLMVARILTQFKLAPKKSI